MFLGLAMILLALLWARDQRRRGADQRHRGPWLMGVAGILIFLFYLWLVTHRALGL